MNNAENFANELGGMDSTFSELYSSWKYEAAQQKDAWTRKQAAILEKDKDELEEDETAEKAGEAKEERGLSYMEMSPLIKEGTDAITGRLGLTAEGIKSKFGDAADYFKGQAEDWMDDVGSRAQSAVEDALGQAKDAASDALGQARDAAADLKGQAEGTYADLRGQAEDAFAQAKDAAQDKFSNLGGGAAEDAADEGMGLDTPLGNFAASAEQKAADAASDLAARVSQGVDAARTGLSDAQTTGEGLLNDAQTQGDQLASAARNAVDDIGNQARGMLNDLTDAGASAARNALEQTRTAVARARAGLEDLGKKMPRSLDEARAAAKKIGPDAGEEGPGGIEMTEPEYSRITSGADAPQPPETTGVDMPESYTLRGTRRAASEFEDPADSFHWSRLDAAGEDDWIGNTSEYRTWDDPFGMGERNAARQAEADTTDGLYGGEDRSWRSKVEGEEKADEEKAGEPEDSGDVDIDFTRTADGAATEMEDMGNVASRETLMRGPEGYTPPRDFPGPKQGPEDTFNRGMADLENAYEGEGDAAEEARSAAEAEAKSAEDAATTAEDAADAAEAGDAGGEAGGAAVAGEEAGEEAAADALDIAGASEDWNPLGWAMTAAGIGLGVYTAVEGSDDAEKAKEAAAAAAARAAAAAAAVPPKFNWAPLSFAGMYVAPVKSTLTG